MMRRIGILGRGLLSLAVLMGITVGAPLAVTWAGLLPHRLPDPDSVWIDLMARDQTGSVLVGVLLLVGGLAWAGFTVSVLREVAATIRTRGARAADPIRGLEWSARPASAMVGSVTMMILTLVGTIPASATSIPSVPTQARITSNDRVIANAVGVSTLSSGRASESQSSASRVAGRQRSYVVQRHDTLWRIAQTQLGDPMRYPEIAALNPQIGPSFEITPGEHLTLPDNSTSTKPDVVVTVEPGDNLSSIAAARDITWETLWVSNAHRSEPGGQRLDDPNLIRPGWTLKIPEGYGKRPRQSHTTKANTHAETSTSALSTEHSGSTPTRESMRPEVMLRHRQDIPRVDDGHPTPGTSRPSAGPPVGGEDLVDDSDLVAQRRENVPWGQIALGGAGTLLAGGLVGLLRSRRQGQFRTRRPGRMIAQPPEEFAPVESAIAHAAALTPLSVDAIDYVLRDLASRVDPDAALPRIAAVQIDGGDFLLHLAESADLPEPWSPRDSHGRVWSRTSPTADDHVPLDEQPQPWPLLVVIGTADDGSAWLLNLEQFGVLNVAGHRKFGQDFLRHVVAGLTCHPWSAEAQVDCIGVGEEFDSVAHHVRIHADEDATQVTTSALRAAHTITDRATQEHADASTGRARQLGDEVWAAHAIILASAATGAAAAGALAQHVQNHPSETGTCVVLTGSEREDCTAITIDSSRRLSISSVGLTVTAVGLNRDEARGCAALLACANDLEDQPMTGDQNVSGEWQEFADHTGAVRTEHVLPRHDPSADNPGDETTAETASLLEADDQTYVQEAATTPEDLATLAPRVTEPVSQQIQQRDPSLEAEVKAWFDPDSRIARVAVLGPIHARTFGPRCEATERKPYFTELLAFLASRGRRGATVDEVAEAFQIRHDRVRKVINVLRTWLGDDPRTGEPYLPDARRSPAAQERGTGVYQVVGVLYDADLFRRLRLRGQARGSDGLRDLATALRLVSGEPFTGIRKGGGAWLGVGDRIDQHMVCAIVDVAHLVATAALHAGDTHRARAAGEIAALAAPHAEIPYLDIAKALESGGNRDQAMKMLAELCNRPGDFDAAPNPLSDRTETIMANHKWLTDNREAS